MANVVVIGATSAMAEAAARLWAARGDRLFLVGRNAGKLQAVADDLRLRGAAAVITDVADLNHTAGHPALVDRAFVAWGGVDTVLVAHGTLGDQAASQASYATALHEIESNALSTISLLTEFANRMEAQRRGTIAVITSVAGDRGRQSNYVYGSAKAMVSTFLAGLRNRLFRSGVHVVTIKPGFVDTPMTAHLPKGLLWAQPASIGAGIVRAIDRRRNVVYLPWFWCAIMLVIRHIPESIFKRLGL